MWDLATSSFFILIHSYFPRKFGGSIYTQKKKGGRIPMRLPPLGSVAPMWDPTTSSFFILIHSYSHSFFIFWFFFFSILILGCYLEGFRSSFFLKFNIIRNVQMSSSHRLQPYAIWSYNCRDLCSIFLGKLFLLIQRGYPRIHFMWSS